MRRERVRKGLFRIEAFETHREREVRVKESGDALIYKSRRGRGRERGEREREREREREKRFLTVVHLQPFSLSFSVSLFGLPNCPYRLIRFFLLSPSLCSRCAVAPSLSPSLWISQGSSLSPTMRSVLCQWFSPFTSLSLSLLIAIVHLLSFSLSLVCDAIV